MANYRQYLLPAVLVLAQIVFSLLFGFHARYTYAPVSAAANLSLSQVSDVTPPRGIVEYYYAMFTDVHVMMFVGFGFLMTFLHRYSFSAVAFNFVLCAFILEWALLVRGYIVDWQKEDGNFILDVKSLITADFVSASVLISMGAVLGKVNGIQLILMGLFEVPVQVVNEWIGTELFCANDAGESMFVHAFGK
jgi:ammonium transporter Rh